MKQVLLSIVVVFFVNLSADVEIVGAETGSDNAVIKNPHMETPISCSVHYEVTSNGVWANVTLSNVTDNVVGVYEPLLLHSKTPKMAPFEVYKDGQSLPYTGVFIKRPSLNANDYYQLKPHGKSQGRVQISLFFDMSSAGLYQVKYTAIYPAMGKTNLCFIESATSPVIVK